MKDKRTKEQIIKLLDNAIEQEERLVNKVKALETELAECRKKVEDPRHELTEGSLPASKVSFRVDYYRTKENGLLKGIIEHLPSRQNKAFEGEGQLVIGHFMNHFLHEEAGRKNKKKAPMVEKKQEPQVAVESVGDDTASYFPQHDITAIVVPEKEAVVLASEEHQTLLSDVVTAPTAAPEAEQSEIKEMISPQPATEVAVTERSSRLLSKLKAKLVIETQTGSVFPSEKESEEIPLPPLPPASKVPPVAEPLLIIGTVSSEKEPKPTPPTGKRNKISEEIRRPRLLERLQAEYNKSINLLALQNN